MNDTEYFIKLCSLRDQIFEEQQVGMRPCAFIAEFLHLPREEQDLCIKYMEDLPRKLRLAQKQYGGEI